MFLSHGTIAAIVKLSRESWYEGLCDDRRKISRLQLKEVGIKTNLYTGLNSATLD